MWGVGAEKKVVATGLGGEGMEVGEGEGNLREVGGSKGKGVAIKGKGNDHWRLEAIRALSITFEVSKCVDEGRRSGADSSKGTCPA